MNDLSLLNNFWINKKVLITGAEGFIGSHLIANIRILGAQVIGTTRREITQLKSLDILDYEKLNNFCHKEGIEIIIHCASIEGNVEFRRQAADLIVDENVRMASNVLRTAKENNISQTVIFSSAAIYSTKAPSPIKEEDDYHLYFPQLDDPYIAAKLCVDMLAHFYAQHFKLPILLLRPTNVYGPSNGAPSEEDRVIPSLIKKALVGENLDIWGQGEQERSFIYITDLVKAVIALVARKGREGSDSYLDVFNLASPDAIRIKDLALKIKYLAKSSSNINLIDSQTIGAVKRILAIDKLQAAINFSPWSLEEGLKQTINHYRQKLYGK